MLQRKHPMKTNLSHLLWSVSQFKAGRPIQWRYINWGNIGLHCEQSSIIEHPGILINGAFHIFMYVPKCLPLFISWIRIHDTPDTETNRSQPDLSSWFVNATSG